MKAYDIFRIFLTHKEVQSRFTSRHLKINGVPVQTLSTEFELETPYMELADFLGNKLHNKILTDQTMDQMRVEGDIRMFFGRDNEITNIKGARFLYNYLVISLAKRPKPNTEFVFKFKEVIHT